MQPGLQEWIHRLEEGEGTRYIRILVLLLGLLVLTFVYHTREAKTFTSVESMDAAQVARNLSRGEGFSTKCIRPVSISLAQEVRGEVPVIKDKHPDLANPPLYPLLLAGVMKLLPFEWQIPEKPFWRYQPDAMIGVVNQVLFYLLLVQVFFLARKLFDSNVAWVAAIVLATTELLWQFSTSGLSTMLLLNIFMALVWCLVLAERQIAVAEAGPTESPGAADPPGGEGTLTGSVPASKAILWGTLAGAAVGLGALTRYSFGWLIFPTVAFLALYANSKRAITAIAATAVFLLLLGPWCLRNYQESRTLFGIPGLHLHEQTALFPGWRLERSMPKHIGLELSRVELAEYPRKLLRNAAQMISSDLPKVTGNWLGAFFLVGLLVPFRQARLSRLRYFLVGAITIFFIAQALGRTQLSEHCPVLNTENLLVIAGPMVCIYGMALFFILLDQIEFPSPRVRSGAITTFVFILSLPLIITLLPPRSYPVDFPEVPYFPPAVQRVAGWMEPNELMMSDMPWAVAWYGDRKCVLITMDHGKKGNSDFFKINDYQKAIQGLYLTPITMDSKFLSQMLKSPDGEWARFVLDSILRTNVPTGFPLKKSPTGLFPEQLFLTDRIRWKK